jgi:hypothetical protein
MLGWLYGEGFEDAILKAVNCGYDTDCTAATLGAILGMMMGPEGLPDKWVKPVGERVVVSPPIKGFPAPANLHELTLRTIRMGKQVLAAWDTEIVVHPGVETVWNRTDSSTAHAEQLLNRKPMANHYLLPKGTIDCPTAELVIDYGTEGPAIGIGQAKSLALTFSNRSTIPLVGSIALELPAGWDGPPSLEIALKPGESIRWNAEVTAKGQAKSAYDLVFHWTRRHDGSDWAAQSVRFVLVAASRWEIRKPDGTEAIAIYSAGNRIAFEHVPGWEADGLYLARTTLTNPIERSIRLIAAANAPYRMSLNGQLLLNCPVKSAVMPAYHRAPNNQWSEFTLPAGTHEIEIEIVRSGDPLQVYLLPVAPRHTSEPGSTYYFTDMLLGAQDTE